jgi:uncharacterized protein YidB (DUF937 family)
MDIMKLATELLSQQFGGQVSEQGASNAISGLLGDGKGGLDIAGLASKFASNGGLKDIVGSWLGDGANSSIDPSQLMEMFGGDKLSDFASNLGVDQNAATSGLSEVLPNLMDKASSGGNILESVGGLSGAMDFAKKLF